MDVNEIGQVSGDVRNGIHQSVGVLVSFVFFLKLVKRSLAGLFEVEQEFIGSFIGFPKFTGEEKPAQVSVNVVDGRERFLRSFLRHNDSGSVVVISGGRLGSNRASAAIIH